MWTLILYLVGALPAFALLGAHPRRAVIITIAVLPLVFVSTPPLETVWLVAIPLVMLELALWRGLVPVQESRLRSLLAAGYALTGAAASAWMLAGGGGLLAVPIGALVGLLPVLVVRSRASQLNRT